MLPASRAVASRPSSPTQGEDQGQAREILTLPALGETEWGSAQFTHQDQ